jgi:hypothetical protein
VVVVGARCLCTKVARRGVCAARRVHSAGHQCSARAVAAGRSGGSGVGLVRFAVTLVRPVVLGMLAAPAAAVSACTLVVWMRVLGGSRRKRPGGGGA